MYIQRKMSVSFKYAFSELSYAKYVLNLKHNIRALEYVHKKHYLWKYEI